MSTIDLFNVNATVENPVASANQSNVDPNMFRPNPKKCPDQVYRAIIRFLPNPVNPLTESIVGRYTTYIENVKNHQKRKVEVLQGDGITETFFNLKNSPLQVLQDRAKHFSRRESYYSLIQICQADPSQPETQGKVLVWEYGRTIKQMIDKQTNPDNPQMDTPKNPFNMLEGRCMALNITMKGVFYNYDNCKFYDVTNDAYCVQVPVETAPDTVQVVPINATTSQNPQVVTALQSWLASAPSLDAYKASTTGHSDEEKQFIFEAIQAALDPNEAPIPVATSAFGTAAAKPIADTVGFGAGPINAQPAPAAMPQMGGVNSFAGVGMSSMPTSQPVAPATAPGGFASSAVPSGLGDILGTPSASPEPAVPAQNDAPVGGLSLGDVLGDIM